MKKTNSIRILMCLLVAGGCAAYAGGYYLSTSPRQNTEKPWTDTNTVQQEENGIVESAVTLPPYEFILRQEDGYIVVYCADGETVYDETSIHMDQLPWKIQREIAYGKYIYSEKELYNFLESYSS